MADEPKSPQPDTPANPPATPAAGSATPTAPALPDPAAQGEGAGPSLTADALSDGTTPTILKSGESHRTVTKGKASITTIYRRADVVTTLLTFGAAVIAAVIILGGYVFFTRSTTNTAPPPKVTTLDKAELDKLNSFFGGNSAGKSAEVLTVSSSSLFNNRVAIASDLKVVGGVQVSGTTALADLTVDKTSTLGVTNIRGALTVSGPASFQATALISGGASINGNLAVTGNGSFGGTLAAGVLNVRDMAVSGTLSLAGHIAITGQNPSANAEAVAGSGASATVDGNDSAGTITITTGTIGSSAPPDLGGLLGKLTFRTAYPRVPRIVITPQGRAAAVLQPYTIKTANNFIIGTTSTPTAHTAYSFDYWVVQ